MSGYETERALSYHKAPTQQAAYARTICDGPTSFYGGCGCGCDEGIPSPRAWNNYGWSVAGSGQGAIRESWHADHTRDEDWTSWVGGAKLSGTTASSSYDDWSFDLTFTEEKPPGTSPYAWRYTGVEGEGWGFFFANRESQASANYQTSVKQGTATLAGLKTYDETLTETNNYTIGFGLTAQGKIAFEIDGLATQSFDKTSTYEGETGTVVFGGGLYAYDTWLPIGRWSDTSSTSTIGRRPTASLISPTNLAAAADLACELGPFRELPLAPQATRTERTANYRRPNAIHAGGSPSRPLNTASVGLKRAESPSAVQRRLAATYVRFMEWEEAAYSREVEIADYGASTGIAKLMSGEDGYLVYPNDPHHPEIPQPMAHSRVRLEVELGAAVDMVGRLYLAWYDPGNTAGNVPSRPARTRGRTDVTDCVYTSSGNT